MKNKQVVLIVLDGWGYREETENNAIATARKPFWDFLWKNYPHSLLKASGRAVGLPDGQMGNSEVGHITIGAGRPVETELTRIDRAIASGEFNRNPALLDLFDHIKKHNSVLHVLGLLSPGGVHSHQNHLFAFLKLAKKMGISRTAIHVFTDGRDTPPQSASKYLKELEKVLSELGSNFFIATISGRYYAMDRDNNWDRLTKVEQALFENKGNICEVKPSAYLENQYKKGKGDELIEPTVCIATRSSNSAIKKNDAVFFFNFRPDRARMLSKKIIERPKIDNIMFVSLTEYCVDFMCSTAFPAEKIKTTLGQEISKAGLQQSHIAETEKFAHATYFLNGRRETPYKGESDIMLDSRKDVKTHDEAPKMRAEAITDKAMGEIKKGIDFIFINFANADMVGHTAQVTAIKKAVETLDAELKKIIGALDKAGGIALITADHGNAEINLDAGTGEKHTAHTANPVPCLITSRDYVLRDGGLADIAPTILSLLNLKTPPTMTGKTLIS